MHVSHLVSQEESLQEPLATRQTLSIADDMEVFEIRPVYHTQRQRNEIVVWKICRISVGSLRVAISHHLLAFSQSFTSVVDAETLNADS